MKDTTIMIFSYITSIITLVFIAIISLILLPFYRIPFGKRVVFKDLTIKLKVVSFGCLFRDFIENILGYSLVFFVNEDGKNQPYFLYIHHKELEKIPSKLWKLDYPRDEIETINQSAVISVETRVSLCGYLPAKIVDYHIENKKLQWSK